MWLLIITLILDDGSGQYRLDAAEFPYASESACMAAQDWWFDHPDTLPKGYTAPWKRITGPVCVPSAPAIS